MIGSARPPELTNRTHRFEAKLLEGERLLARYE